MRELIHQEVLKFESVSVIYRNVCKLFSGIPCMQSCEWRVDIANCTSHISEIECLDSLLDIW